jgi:hypothetical protein
MVWTYSAKAPDAETDSLPQPVPGYAEACQLLRV